MSLSSLSQAGTISSCKTITPSHSLSTTPRFPPRTIKVVLIGDGGCGKTSLRHQFLSGKFSPSYRTTIGADFITRSLPLDPLDPNSQRVTLQIWDTAGQERFQSLGSAFYRGADAVMIAFDLTDVDRQLESIEKWYHAFMEKAPGPSDEQERQRFCWICVGNKADLLSTEVDRNRVQQVLNKLVPCTRNQKHGRNSTILPSSTNSPSEVSVQTVAPPLPPSSSSSTATTTSTPTTLTPANPQDVLSRPDPSCPNSYHQIAQRAETNAKTLDLCSYSSRMTFETPCGSMMTNTLNPDLISSSPPPPPSFTLPTGLSVLRGDKLIHKRGHQTRQSIKSIQVFQPDDTSSVSSIARKVIGTSSGGSVLTPSPIHQRQRVDSSISLQAPSIYHTPPTSTIFSVSPTTPTSTMISASTSSIHGINPLVLSSTRRSLKPSDTNSIISSSSSCLSPSSSKHPIVRSNLLNNQLFETDTLIPPPSNGILINSNDSIIPFPIHLSDSSSLSSVTSHSRSSSASASTFPPTILEQQPSSSNDDDEEEDDLETGFSLFYTSAKTGQNVDCLFHHIVDRVNRKWNSDLLDLFHPESVSIQVQNTNYSPLSKKSWNNCCF